MRRTLPLLLAAVLVTGCGSSSTSGPTTTTTTTPGPPTAPSTGTETTPVPAAKIAARIYLVRDGRIAPVRRLLPSGPAVGQAALAALATGPTEDERAAGLSTAIGALRLTGLTIENGEADLRPLTHASQLAEGQIVYTLTQFPTVQRVRIGDDVLDRSDLEDVTPVILVDSPLPGETVSSPIEARGTSNTFEATHQLELRRNGEVLAKETVTASSGSGERGTWSATIDADAPAGPAELVAYESSAENGSRIHVVRIPLTVRP